MDFCPVLLERLSKVFTIPLTVPRSPRRGAAAIIAAMTVRCARKASLNSFCLRRNSGSREGWRPRLVPRRRRSVPSHKRRLKQQL